MTNSKDLIIISASCGKNLELSQKFHEKSIELKLNSEILDLTTFDIPLFNPRIHTKEKIPNEINEIKEKLFVSEKWIICAPEYNGSIPFSWNFCESSKFFPQLAEMIIRSLELVINKLNLI